MIKGCSKRVIVMKNTGHEMIEEAFFILKPDAAIKGKLGESDILKQANTILDEKGLSSPFSSLSLNVNAEKKAKHGVTDFLWGVAVGITVTCILMLIAG